VGALEHQGIVSGSGLRFWSAEVEWRKLKARKVLCAVQDLDQLVEEVFCLLEDGVYEGGLLWLTDGFEYNSEALR
jgi:hypothetical protein